MVRRTSDRRPKMSLVVLALIVNSLKALYATDILMTDNMSLQNKTHIKARPEKDIFNKSESNDLLGSLVSHNHRGNTDLQFVFSSKMVKRQEFGETVGIVLKPVQNITPEYAYDTPSRQVRSLLVKTVHDNETFLPEQPVIGKREEVKINNPGDYIAHWPSLRGRLTSLEANTTDAQGKFEEILKAINGFLSKGDVMETNARKASNKRRKAIINRPYKITEFKMLKRRYKKIMRDIQILEDEVTVTERRFNETELEESVQNLEMELQRRKQYLDIDAVLSSGYWKISSGIADVIDFSHSPLDDIGEKTVIPVTKFGENPGERKYLSEEIEDIQRNINALTGGSAHHQDPDLQKVDEILDAYLKTRTISDRVSRSVGGKLPKLCDNVNKDEDGKMIRTKDSQLKVGKGNATRYNLTVRNVSALIKKSRQNYQNHNGGGKNLISPIEIGGTENHIRKSAILRRHGDRVLNIANDERHSKTKKGISSRSRTWLATSNTWLSNRVQKTNLRPRIRMSSRVRRAALTLGKGHSGSSGQTFGDSPDRPSSENDFDHNVAPKITRHKFRPNITDYNYFPPKNTEHKFRPKTTEHNFNTKNTDVYNGVKRKSFHKNSRPDAFRRIDEWDIFDDKGKSKHPKNLLNTNDFSDTIYPNFPADTPVTEGEIVHQSGEENMEIHDKDNALDKALTQEIEESLDNPDDAIDGRPHLDEEKRELDFWEKAIENLENYEEKSEKFAKAWSRRVFQRDGSVKDDVAETQPLADIAQQIMRDSTLESIGLPLSKDNEESSELDETFLKLESPSYANPKSTDEDGNIQISPKGVLNVKDSAGFSLSKAMQILNRMEASGRSFGINDADADLLKDKQSDESFVLELADDVLGDPDEFNYLHELANVSVYTKPTKMLDEQYKLHLNGDGDAKVLKNDRLAQRAVNHLENIAQSLGEAKNLMKQEQFRKGNISNKVRDLADLKKKIAEKIAMWEKEEEAENERAVPKLEQEIAILSKKQRAQYNRMRENLLDGYWNRKYHAGNNWKTYKHIVDQMDDNNKVINRLAYGDRFPFRRKANTKNLF